MKTATAHTLWPDSVFAVYPVSRHWHFNYPHCASSLARNGANRKSMAIFPFQPHAVALLRLRAAINQTRVFPQPLATTDNPETRDLGLKTRGVRAQYHTRSVHFRIPNFVTIPRFCNCLRFHPAVARLSIPLAARGRGIMRILLMVADTRRSATAEDGNSKNGQG